MIAEFDAIGLKPKANVELVPSPVVTSDNMVPFEVVFA